MVHTYRDPGVPEGRPPFWRAAAFPLLLGGLALLGLGLGQWVAAVSAAVLTACCAAVLGGRHHARRCRTIRLDDVAGTCELETPGGVITLHVTEIASVLHDDEYRIRSTRGRVVVERGMRDLDDFLARLERLNPAVDLGRRGRPTSIRTLIFPAVVVVCLLFVAFETLAGH
jgi:hypothetical protein